MIISNSYLDDSFNFSYLYEKLAQDYLKHDRIIILYDLDDTVRPYFAKSCDMTVETIKRCKKVLNPWFIVYTANPDYEKNWNTIKELGLPCDAMNTYPDDPAFDYFRERQKVVPAQKLYCNIMLDDKSFGLREATMALNMLCNNVIQNSIEKKEN